MVNLGHLRSKPPRGKRVSLNLIQVGYAKIELWLWQTVCFGMGQY
jgi:hypothetical protein